MSSLSNARLKIVDADDFNIAYIWGSVSCTMQADTLQVPERKVICKRVHGVNSNKHKYVDLISAFDIETTGLEEIEQSVMYLWSWQIGKCTVMGRTWEQFKEVANMIVNRVCQGGTRVVVYVHNLSYEFQFLTGIYHFAPEDVFAVDRRKILKCMMFNGLLEFRCSYLLTNMSLDKFTKSMNVPHAKLSGEEFDYSKRRMPWSDLTERELEYSRNDVLGLCEALQAKMRKDGDNLASIPMTSTGYVRRDARAAMKKEFLPCWKTPVEVYTLLKEAFRGGNTHANRCFAGTILKGVKSADRSSSYPDCQCNDIFPVGEWHECNVEVALEKHYATVFRVKLTNVRLREATWGCPYIAIAKCRNMVGVVADNGRVLQAESLETTITDVDWLIFKGEYTWDGCEFGEGFASDYGMLPDALTNCTKYYYENKTKLKGNPDKEYEYGKDKAKLNSIYGMSAQDIGKPAIEFVEELVNEPYRLSAGKSLEQRINDSNDKAFQSYAWGVWITAWARYRLEEGIKLAGENFVYCDTDSVKYIGEIDWSTYNEKRKNASLTHGAWADDAKGIRHYMGVYEADGEYEEFVTLGAKKYAYRENGEVHITVAGVGKKAGAKELGDLVNFRPGFLFEEAGGTCSVYNDYNYGIYEVDEKALEITKNIYIKDSTYRLSITHDYANIVQIFNRNLSEQNVLNVL